MLGIFLILPVFSSYVLLYPGSSHLLTGLAFGIYALVQAALQIPFGWASDRFGRKHVIIAGFVLFCAGSIACGLADNVWQLIAARSLQGSGAVGSVAIAALGDSTRPEVRGQSFAITGIIIGGTFMLSLAVGPIMASWLGLKAVFYILAALGVLAIAITVVLFPKDKTVRPRNLRVKTLSFLSRGNIKKILVSSFILSSILNIFLFVYPLSWESATGRGIEQIWKVYLIVLLPAAVFAYPFLKIMERRKKMNTPPLVALAFLTAGTGIALISGEKTGLILAGAAFFMGHSIFQPLLPSFLTQIVSGDSRGNMVGFLSLASFLGAFAGSILAGLAYAAGTGAPLAVCFLFLTVLAITGIPEPPGTEQTDGK